MQKVGVSQNQPFVFACDDFMVLFVFFKKIDWLFDWLIDWLIDWLNVGVKKSEGYFNLEAFRFVVMYC